MRNVLDKKYLMEFFNGKYYDFNIVYLPLTYPHMIFVKNERNQFICIYNRMVDLEGWDEVGIIEYSKKEKFDKKNHIDTKFSNVLSLNDINLGKLDRVLDLYIKVQEKRIRSGLSFKFKEKKIKIFPSEAQYCLYINGLDKFMNKHLSEYPTEEYEEM